MKRRFFALLMAVLMLLSCTAVASATNEVSEENVVITENGLSVTPRYHGDLTGIIDGTSVGANGSFTVLEETYVTLVINCKVDGNVIVYGSEAGGIPEVRFKAPGGSFSFSQKLPAGTYGFTITLHNNTQAWAAKFMATDYYYFDQK